MYAFKYSMVLNYLLFANIVLFLVSMPTLSYMLKICTIYAVYESIKFVPIDKYSQSKDKMSFVVFFNLWR